MGDQRPKASEPCPFWEDAVHSFIERSLRAAEISDSALERMFTRTREADGTPPFKECACGATVNARPKAKGGDRV